MNKIRTIMTARPTPQSINQLRMTVSNVVTLNTKFGQLILRKIVKIVATMSDFKAKMHQMRFWLGLCPIPRWGSLQPPYSLAGFKGAYFEGKGRERKGGERKRGEESGRKRRERGPRAFPQLQIWHYTTGRYW